MSDVPIRLSKPMRKLLLTLNKAKTLPDRLGLLMKIFSSKPLTPEVVIYEFIRDFINLFSIKII